MGEVEIEGAPELVAEWWDRLSVEAQDWDEKAQPTASQQRERIVDLKSSGSSAEAPKMFGEYFSAFRSDITDVDRMLIAASFLQGRSEDRAFTTSQANKILIEQNIKLSNPSQSVRRLIAGKKVFVVASGKYRVSAPGLESIETMRSSQ